MNLEFSEEQRLFADALGRFLQNEYSFERRQALVAAREWGSPTIWQGLAELGCFMLSVPEAAGGLGGRAVEIGILGRALGRHLVIEPVRSAVVAGVLLANAQGTDADLEGLMAGTDRYAVMEPHLTIRGKSIIPGAFGANGILVFDGGLSVISCDADLRAVQLLDDSMALEGLIDPQGARCLSTGLHWNAACSTAEAFSCIFLFFEALGSIETALADTAAYVLERRQFDKPIGRFQVIQHRVAEMAVAAKEAEAAALLAALTFDAAGPSLASDRAIAAATTRIAAVAEQVGDAAVQLHGGMGVSNELSISAHFRKLQAFRFLSRPVDKVAEQIVTTRAHHHSAVLLEA